MGCCVSTTSSDPNPHADGAASTNLPRAIGVIQPSVGTSSLDNDPSSSNPAGTSRVRPNKPLEKPAPLPRSPKNVSNVPPPWPRSHLERQREIFFETRVSGRTEVWQTLRLVCELLRHDDLPGAQAVLDAANLTVPHGKVGRGRSRTERQREGVYDEQGMLYDIPYWVVTDPGDVVEDVEEKDVDDEEDEEEEEVDGDGEIARLRRQEKGKGRAEDIGEEVRLRARLSDRATDVEVVLGSKQTVAVAIRQIKDKVPEIKHCQLVYLGRSMKENETLEAQGWRTGHVVNAFISCGDEGVVVTGT